MTPAEIVAVKLFGYKPIVELRKGDWTHGHLFSDGRAYGSHEAMPDFRNDQIQWHSIRRVEDAIWEKGLSFEYRNVLWKTKIDREWDYEYQMRATVPQRLEAAIRVIEEAGL